MQGIGGEQHAADPQLGDQRWHGRDLAGRPGHLLVGQDEGGVAGEGAEHMSRFPVVQVVEAAAQRLAIERDGALAGHLDGPVQLSRMAPEGALEIVLVERQEQTAQRVHGWPPSEARPEGSVQAVALDGDEGDDLLVGGRPRQNRKNREQQQMAQAIALPLRAAWIVDSFERGKQQTKRHQGDLHQLRTSLQQIRYRTLRVPTLGRVGSGRRGRTAWPWEHRRGARSGVMSSAPVSTRRYQDSDSGSLYLRVERSSLLDSWLRLSLVAILNERIMQHTCNLFDQADFAKPKI